MRKSRPRPPTSFEAEGMTLDAYAKRIREWLEHRTQHFGSKCSLDGRLVSREMWINEHVEDAVAREKDRREHLIADRVAQLREDGETIAQRVTPEVAAHAAAQAVHEIRKGATS